MVFSKVNKLAFLDNSPHNILTIIVEQQKYSNLP
jgi:hypothetical protein